ncbi:MAG: hypothetical protein P0120_06980 [Nitrospira sp.]|nr:hypothetical protein [Nitrospira sp.]
MRGEQTDIQLSLKQRAEFLCQGLLEGDDRLGDRPIVFVAHSLGGLMVKAMLEREWISRGDKSRILSQTKAVVFLGTPHSGSSLANLAETLAQGAISGTGMLGMALANSLGSPMSIPGDSVGNKLAKWILGPSATTESLKDDNPELFDLMKSYRAISRERSIETLSYFETMNYMGVAIVVSQSSADPGLVDAALYSQFDIDKLVLIAWRKYRLEQALLDDDGITRGRIDDLVAKIRTMAEVSLLAGLSSNRRQ